MSLETAVTSIPRQRQPEQSPHGSSTAATIGNLAHAYTEHQEAEDRFKKGCINALALPLDDSAALALDGQLQKPDYATHNRAEQALVAYMKATLQSQFETAQNIGPNSIMLMQQAATQTLANVRQFIDTHCKKMTTSGQHRTDSTRLAAAIDFAEQHSGNSLVQLFKGEKPAETFLKDPEQYRLFLLSTLTAAQLQELQAILAQ